MKSEIRTILLGIGQFLFCALLSASAYGLYVLNLRVSVPVESLIELGQEALLLSAAIFTLRTASLEKALSGGLWLVGGIHRTSRLHDDLHERRLLCRQLPANAPPQGPRRTPTEGSRHQDRLTRPQPAKRKGPES